MKKVEKNVLSLIAPIHEDWSQTLTYLAFAKAVGNFAAFIWFAYCCTDIILMTKGDWSNKFLIIQVSVYAAAAAAVYFGSGYYERKLFEPAKTTEIFWWRRERLIILERDDFQRLCNKFDSSEPVNENDPDYKSLMEVYRSQLMKSRHRATHVQDTNETP